VTSLADGSDSRSWGGCRASWSARRVLMHLIAETAQHAGAIREYLDGAKSMG
jgi:hypothetical protein